MIEPTLGTIVAFVIGCVGLVPLLNGLRYALVDEVVFGAILLAFAAVIYETGPLL